jgi:hypothetical protein
VAEYPPHGLTAARLATYATFDVDTPNVAVAIDSAVDYLRDRAGWHVFPEVTEALLLDGEGGRILVLPTLRVSSLTSVRQLGELVSPESYSWSAGGEVRLKSTCASWTEEYRGVEVTLTHGFQEPARLLKALAQVVATATINPLGIPEVIGPFQFTGSAGSWSGEPASTLGRFTLPWRA